MRVANVVRSGAVAAAFACAFAAVSPALANPPAAGADYTHGQTGPAPMPQRPMRGDAAPTPGQPMHGQPIHGAMQMHQGHGDDMRARQAWIDECTDRLGGRDEMRARDECERYLHDYYASYMRPGYGYAQAYAQPAHGYGCCQAQPMMMAPVRMAPSEPRCTETVEYVYEDVPVTPRPRPRPVVRPVPDKRIKVVPDKRIRN